MTGRAARTRARLQRLSFDADGRPPAPATTTPLLLMPSLLRDRVKPWRLLCDGGPRRPTAIYPLGAEASLSAAFLGSARFICEHPCNEQASESLGERARSLGGVLVELTAARDSQLIAS